jgi:membrane protein YdbS with pleckstrin-like domain
MTENVRGVTFTGLLQIVFIVLKLTNIIQWSWLWVLSPFWISSAVAIVLLIILAIIDKLYE